MERKFTFKTAIDDAQCVPSCSPDFRKNIQVRQSYENTERSVDRLLNSLKIDLKALAKQICFEEGENVWRVFPNKMLAEMIVQMPRTRQALLRITDRTEAIYENYQGERFLQFFQSYGRQLDECRAKEERKKQAEAAHMASIDRAFNCMQLE